MSFDIAIARDHDSHWLRRSDSFRTASGGHIDPSSPRAKWAKTNSEVASFTKGFSVLAPFIITSITPNSAYQGQQNLSVAVVGQNTHFAQNVSVLDLAGAGVTVTRFVRFEVGQA